MLERGSWGGFERGYAATLPPFILTHPSLSPLLEETVFDQCPPLQDHSTTHTLKSEKEREACLEKPCFWLCRVTTVKSGVSRTWQSRDSDSTVVPLPTATSRPQPAPSIHSRDLTHGDRARGDQE